MRGSHHIVAAFVEAEFRKLAVNAAKSRSAGEVGCSERCREVQVLLDSEVLVKGVVLRDVGDVFAKCFSICVKRASVKEDIALGRWKLPGNGAHQGALPAAAGPHDANHFSSLHRKGNAIDGHLSVAKAANDIVDVERADDVPLLFDKTLAEIAAQNLPRIDANSVAIVERCEISHWHSAHKNWTIRLEDFDTAFFPIVIAVDLQ